MIGRAPAAILVLGAAAAACAPGRDVAPVVTVYAAASTAPFMTAFAERYEATTGVRMRCSFAASSTLARQIEEGAPADVFLSAHPRWMDHLEAAGRLAVGRRRDLLGNRLVLAVPAAAAPASVVELERGADVAALAAWPGRVAIGDPDHVPVGIYARQALGALGWWDALAPRLLPAKDARAAARLVEMREAAAAVVYESDVVATDAIAVAARFDPGLHEPIRYPVALLDGAGAAASALFVALTAPETEPLRASFGFSIPN